MRILVTGGGFVGTYTALRLERLLRRTGHEIVLVNPQNFLQYQPFLAEAAAGNIEPRHAVVPLRHILRRTRLVVGEVETIDHANRCATVRTIGGAPLELGYDEIVVAPGSVSRTLPIPGLAEQAVGFKTIAEAIHLRNVVLSRLEAAADCTDPERRRAILTFVFVGGGYAGLEALAELEDLTRSALRRYPELHDERPRWVLIEAADRILLELDAGLASYAHEQLAQRGVEIRLETQLESAENGMMRLSTGDTFPAETLVWTAGVRPTPLATDSGLPVDDQGRVTCDEYLRIRRADGEVLAGAWAAGDGAAVPDLTAGGLCPPTAQHALRQGQHLAANLAATIGGNPPRPFRYRNLGQLVSLGRYRGVARLPARIRLSGFSAWWLRRTYHLARMPTMNRRVRIAFDWTVTLLFPRDITALGTLEQPGEPLERAADPEEQSEPAEEVS